MTPNNINPNSANSDTKQEEHITFSVHDLIQTVIANWYWFVISVIVCVGCSYIYILRTPKIYSRTANILVKDSRKGGDTNLAALSDLAGLSQMRNVDNEIYILQSRRLMTEVEAVGTDRSIRNQGGIASPGSLRTKSDRSGFYQ